MNRKLKVRIYNVIVVVLLACGMVYVVSKFVHPGNVEFTDNAYVHQHITPINSRIQGFIKEIRFNGYAPVHKGDTLAIIEDTEYRLRVAQAEAALNNALAVRRCVRAPRHQRGTICAARTASCRHCGRLGKVGCGKLQGDATAAYPRRFRGLYPCGCRS